MRQQVTLVVKTRSHTKRPVR